MYLRRSGNRTDRRRLARSARKSTSVQLLLESLEPRRLLTANDVGSSVALDINDPQIVVAQGEMSVPIAPVQSGLDIVSFYGYYTVNPYASNTGYETSGLVTFLVHEDASGDTGLVVLVDAPHDQGGGTVNFDIDGLDSAIVAVADDPNEGTPSSESTLFTRSWNAQASDGAAFSNLGYYFSITVTPNYLFGVDGFQVIDGADDSTVAIPLADEAFEIYAEYGLEISAVPSAVSEAAGTMIATITRGGAAAEDLLVVLESDEPSRATVPQTVLIPAGSSSAEFTIDLIDNSLPYDAYSLGISASADYLRSTQVTMDIVDDDLPLLDVGMELAWYDSNGTESSSGYLLAGTTATHVAFVTNTQTSTFSQPMVFDDSQTPGNSSDDLMFTPHRNASDANVGDLNNNFLFDPGEVWQFSLARTVGSGQHLAQVYCGAIDPVLDIVLSTATPAEYFGVLPAVTFAQSFSLVDGAGFGTNMSVLSGSNVTASYQLTNQGNVGLADVSVSGAAYVSGDTNTDDILDIDEVWTYSQTSSAEAGEQSVSAEVTARDALTDTTVETSATGSYFGAVPAVAMSQALAATHVLSGAAVEVEYQLTNQGNVGLADVSVSGAAYVSGDTNTDDILDIDEVWTYSQTSSAEAGEQSVSAEVMARDALTDTTVETSATGSYFGAVPAVAMSQALAATHVLSGAIEFVPVTGPNLGANYQMGKYEISNAEWDAVMGTSSGTANMPKVYISLLDAAEFVNNLNSAEGSVQAYTFLTGGASSSGLAISPNHDGTNKFRNKDAAYWIPTEAEYEDAAFWNGSSMTSYANGTAAAPTHSDANFQGGIGSAWAVGSGTIEQNGTFDMNGNVAEWLEDDTNTVYAASGPFENHQTQGGAFHLGTYAMPHTFDWVYHQSDTAYYDWAGLRIATNAEQSGGGGGGAGFGTNMSVLSGSNVTASYQLTNQGNVGLADVSVSGAAYVSGDTNTDDILDIDEVWTYSQTSSAEAGEQSVSAEVTARDALTDTTVETSATGSYFGAVPAVAMSQALAATHVLSGAAVEVEYQLTNQGNVGLADVSVSGAAYVSGDTNTDDILDIDEVWTYSQTSSAEEGEQSVSAEVTARDALTDTTVETSATGSYFGAVPAVAMSQALAATHVLSGAIEFVPVTGPNLGANYQMGKYEISNAEWDAVMGTSSGTANMPKVYISLLDAAEFVNNLNSAEGSVQAYTFLTGGASSSGLAISPNHDGTNKFRNKDAAYWIPTEAEYEDAAFWNGSSMTSYANGTAAAPTHSDANFQGGIGSAWAVGSGTIEQNGTFDMNGNVAEWLEDDTNTVYAASGPFENHQTQGGAFHLGTYAMPHTFDWVYHQSDTAYYDWAGLRIATNAEQSGGGGGGAGFGTNMSVLSGSNVTASYQLTNQGNVGLADVSVSGAAYVSGDTNTDDILDIDEVWTYSQTSSAEEGEQSVSAEVTARDALTDTTVETSATGSYFGAVPAVAMSQALAATHVLSGAAVEVEYQLTNQGNVGLADVSVSGAAYVSGDTNTDDILDIDEVWTYSQTSSAEEGEQSVSAEVTARDALTDTTVETSATGSYFGAAVDWVLASQWDGVDDQQVPNFIVGESFHLAFYLENVGNVELTNIEMQGAAPVLSGQAVDGDFDGDGQIDPGEVWKYESFGTVALGEHTQIATAAAASTRLGAPLASSLETSYFGQYRSLAVTHTGDEGLGSLRYAIEDAASRPEGGQIYFDLSEDDPNFVDVDNHLPGGDAGGDIFLFQPLSALPSLDGSGAIEIVGSGPMPIVIDGSLAGSSHGLEIFSDGNLVRDLTIQNFELSGIHVLGSENTIAGNRIGINTLAGEAGNGGDGVWIENGSQNLIGGEDEDGVDQNIIAHNAGNGVAVQAGTANRIGTNAFYENAGMGIDLGRDGFTPNDVQGDSVDADSGANNLINTPVITRIEIVGQTVEVDYQVPVSSAEMEGPLRIEFFRTDVSRREGAEFLGTDAYTAEDVRAGGKTLVAEINEFPDLNSRIVATATSALGNTSEFSAPSGIRFTGRSDEATQQDVVDSVADGILTKFESLLSGQTPVPTPAPGQPIITPSLPVHDFVLDNPVIEQIIIGRNVFAEDETYCALNVGSGADPLLMIGFGEAVDDVTMAVNDYCVELVYDLADSLSLTAGQMVAVIWFDPINFTVSIGDNQVSYDYDNNPTELTGSIPGASLVITSASATTPGGVQGIMFAGDVSTINIQMSTTSSGELMRGGVNIYTVGTGAGGTTIQPSIRTVFQGHLPGESVMMAFDPSAAPTLLVGGGTGSTSQSMAGISSPGTSGRGGAGGGIPMSIPGIFSGVGGFELAFLDPASMANAGLDISGSSSEAGEDESDVEDLENQVQEEYGSETDDREEEEDDTDLDGREEGDEDSNEFEDAPPVEDEEEIEESISAIFDLLGGALASKSGRIDVMEILMQGSTANNHQRSSSSGDVEVVPPRWAHSENEYDQIVTDRWATSFDARESDKTWTGALVAARKEG